MASWQFAWLTDQPYTTIGFSHPQPGLAADLGALLGAGAVSESSNEWQIALDRGRVNLGYVSGLLGDRGWEMLAVETRPAPQGMTPGQTQTNWYYRKPGPDKTAEELREQVDAAKKAAAAAAEAAAHAQEEAAKAQAEAAAKAQAAAAAAAAAAPYGQQQAPASPQAPQAPQGPGGYPQQNPGGYPQQAPQMQPGQQAGQPGQPGQPQPGMQQGPQGQGQQGPIMPPPPLPPGAGDKG